MIIKQARKILGEEGKKYSDDELERLISQLTELAEIVADVVSRRGSNEGSRGIDGTLQTTHNQG